MVNGGTALLMPLPHQIDPHRFEHAGEVQRRYVRKKRRSSMASTASTITLGMSLYFTTSALRALFGVEQCRHQLRFQFVGGEFIALARDALDRSILNLNVRRLPDCGKTRVPA